MKEVIVVTGIDDTARAVVRRIGAGYRWVLADLAQDRLEAAAHEFIAAGYDVTTAVVDIVSKHSVARLARLAAGLGPIHALVHTAGLSSATANPAQILKVNLIGTARIVEEFGPHLTAGSLGIMAANTAEYAGMNEAIEQQLATLKADDSASFISTLNIQDAPAAYRLAKRSSLAQVYAAAGLWEAKGARIISISTVTTATSMAPKEQMSQPAMSYLLKQSQENGICTPEDIAAVVDLMRTPLADSVTGFDVLVGKGVTVYTKLG